MTPPVLLWYARYCRAVAGGAAILSVAGAAGVVRREDVAAALGTSQTGAALLAALMSLSLLFFASIHLATLRTPPAAWTWKLNAVILAMGLTTLVLWPAALPLLYFWLQPDNRRFHERHR